MFRHNLAYRHQNNDVEGFVGIGFIKANALIDAVRQIERKCQDLGQPYDANRLIRDQSKLTAEELKLVKQHWRIG